MSLRPARRGGKRMRRTSFIGAVAFVMLLIAAGGAWAQDGRAFTRLRAFDEVPALSTPGGGRFEATITGEDTIQYELTYFNMKGVVTQSHIQLAQRGVNGGIMVFLCSNLGNGPVGTQACPPDGTRQNPATVPGTIPARDIISGAGAQGIGAGEFSEDCPGDRGGVLPGTVRRAGLGAHGPV